MPDISRDLLFQAIPLSGAPTHLLFNVSEEAIQRPPVTSSVSVSLSGSLTVSALTAYVVESTSIVSLSGPIQISVVSAYDNRVTPWKDGRITALMQPAVVSGSTTDAAWALSVAERKIAEVLHHVALPNGSKFSLLDSTAIAQEKISNLQWQLAITKGVGAVSQYQKAVPQTYGVSLMHEVADLKATQSTSAYQKGVFLLSTQAHLWQWAQQKVKNLSSYPGTSLYTSGVQFQLHYWQAAGQARNGRSILVPVTQTPDTPAPSRELVFECPPLLLANLIFGAFPCYPNEPIPGLVIVPARRIYMVINNASLRRVDGNIALPVFSMSLSVDADSWTWSFSAALPGSVLSNLEPSEAGAPVEVEALINGVAYRALVERVSRERSFGKNDIRASGRGKTALLDSPYAPSQSFSNTFARTAQQLADDVLTVNGQSMGWTVTWGLEDWLVPAGVFAQQGSYISALTAIANAAGGYVQPHASLQSISILPRYPAAPWAWAAVTPDFELPSDVTSRESIEWLEKARYNRVFISGQQSGVLGQVTRAGTAGDLIAPMVTDALITTAAAARQRGISVLADTGRQAQVSLRLPVLAETGVITPGKFVRYSDAGTSRIGLVRSVGVEVGMPEIWQTLGVQTYA